MAKTTVLTCDACPQNGHVILAKDRLHIRGLTDAPLTVDLCEKHLGALRDAVTFVSEPKKKVKHLPRNGSSLSARITEYMSQHKGNVPSAQITDALSDGDARQKRIIQTTLANMHHQDRWPIERVEKGVYRFVG